MLQLLPWCALEQDYDLGALRLLGVGDRKPLKGLSTQQSADIQSFISCYRSMDGRPVDPYAVVAFNGVDPLRVLTDDELRECSELLQLAAFSSLASRSFFRAPYSNNTCFVRYIQMFNDVRGIAVLSRRRDGGTLDGRILPGTVFGIPSQAAAVHTVHIDAALFAALDTHRKDTPPKEWTRWQNAIDCFNFANSDDSNVPPEVEWIMMASAMERLLNADANASSVAAAVEAAITPEHTLLAGNASRKPSNPKLADRSLRYLWAYEFYRMRGQYAHGYMTSAQPYVWTPFEHLLLAAIAVPLAAKALLACKEIYTLTDDDWAQVDGFEGLLDTHFLIPLDDQESSWDSKWGRIQATHHGRRSLRRWVHEHWPVHE